MAAMPFYAHSKLYLHRPYVQKTSDRLGFFSDTNKFASCVMHAEKR